MPRTKQQHASTPTRRLAWDGISLSVPASWELGLYKYLKKGVKRIEIEDEYTVRLEIEWVRPTRQLALAQIQQRYEKAAKALAAKANDVAPLAGLPDGWLSTLYTFAETIPGKTAEDMTMRRRYMATAFRLSPDSKLFCFMLLRFDPEDTEAPEPTTRLVLRDFQDYPGPLVPWELFDIAFETPRSFVLESTTFDIGAKLSVFRWKLRRFYIWHFSLASMFLEEGMPEEECVAGYLNDYRHIRGVLFSRVHNGEVAWKRRRLHPFGHRDEFTRWCFNYQIHYHRDLAKDQLIVWVFNYRRPGDLAMIPPSLCHGVRLDVGRSPTA